MQGTETLCIACSHLLSFSKGENINMCEFFKGENYIYIYTHIHTYIIYVIYMGKHEMKS